MSGLENVDAAAFIVVLEDGGDLAGLAIPLDEDVADLEEYSHQFESHRGHCFLLLLLAVEEKVKLRNQVVVDERGDFGCCGVKDSTVVHIFLRHISVHQVEQVLHAGEPDIVLVGLENLAHKVWQELA